MINLMYLLIHQARYRLEAYHDKPRKKNINLFLPSIVVQYYSKGKLSIQYKFKTLKINLHGILEKRGEKGTC